jgi:ABC-2 type transport system permease protein
MAGIDGAGLSADVLSSTARAQYAAMAALRWQMLKNGLRTKMGAFELGARTLRLVLFGIGGVMLGTGAVMAAYYLASGGEWRFLPILYWAVGLLWLMLPLMAASFQEQFDLGILLRFPVSFGSYYLLYVVFGLADVSSILGALCCLGIWAGITAARPELSAWTALALLIFAAFNVLLVRAIFAWIDRWLSQRKTREIVGVVFMLLILSLQLLNPALHGKRHSRPSRSMTPEQAQELVRESQQQKAEFRAKYGPWLKTADAVQQWLPPGLAARAVQQVAQAKPLPGLASLGVLGLWMLAAGGVLARRLRSEYRGEELSSAPKRLAKREIKRAKAAVSGREEGWRSSSIAALVEKEARALMRTLPLLWAVCIPVLMVLVLASLFRNGSSGVRTFQFALPLYVAYALLGFTQLFYNNLGAEGAGIQLLFLSPTPIRKVFLAKNLLHSLLFALDAVLAVILASLRIGWPSGVLLAATAAWVLFALPCSLAAGNILSITMPYRINPGRIGRQRGSQANGLSSVLAQLVMMIVGAAVFALCWFLENLWLAVPIFLALAAGAVYAWLRVLGNVDALANQRRDALMATLMKAD